MELQQILEKLCYYDKRNPNNYLEYIDEEDIPKDICYCDNCFYSRTELANEILKLNVKK